MQFWHKLAVITALFCCTFASAQTTQFTGTVKDLTNTPVASGQITFTLQPGADTTISGVARFTPIAVTCAIVNQAISSISRAANVVTVTTSSAHGFTTGDLVNIVGVTDTSYNANGLTITVTGGTTFTYAQTAGNSSSSGGFAGNLFKPTGTGGCIVVNNTALTPAGTSYKVSICPFFACTSQFTTFATGGTVDLTTAVPTPATLPTYSFVDTFSNQSIGGNKTFTGLNIFAANGDPISPILGEFWLSSTNAGRFKWYDGAAIRTVVGADTTDTLANKTLASPVVNGTPSGSGVPTVTLKKGSGAGNYTASNTSYANVDTTNLCQVVTVPSGWKLVIAATGSILTATAPANALVSVADIGTTCGGGGTTPLQEIQITAPGIAAPAAWNLSWLVIGDGAAHAISLQARTTAVADAWVIGNSSSTLTPSMVLTLTPSN